MIDRSRHSGAGRNPARQTVRVADKIWRCLADETTSHSTKLAKKRQQSRWLYANIFSTDWIPA
ncbi:MAG: hypothetical protein KGL01_03275, partial [Betaproteobacteria bacterium]|nr:hypothetical protein [Betaproteobacteria bacterium]